MAKIYYIDSENVGDSWFHLLEEPDVLFRVFYTENSPRLAYPQAIQLMNAATKPTFIACHKGHNSLDFQLVTYLGYELHEDSANEFIIVSNDTGYDAVALFWSERGMKVSRKVPFRKSNVKSVQTSTSADKVVISSLSVKVEEKIHGVSRSELDTIINCIGKNESSYIHLTLVHFYGNKNGDEIYQILKKAKFEAPAVHWEKSQRIEKLITLILTYLNTSKTAVPQSFQAYLAKNLVGDKKSMRAKLVKQYPANGAYLHKMFKPFYKTLAKIKR